MKKLFVTILLAIFSICLVGCSDSDISTQQRETEFRTTDTAVEWKYIDEDTWTKITDVVQQREIEYRTTNTAVEWKYIDEDTWTKITDVVQLREVEFRTTDMAVEWKYTDEDTWTKIIDVVEPREVEFRITDTTIEWKYTDDETWTIEYYLSDYLDNLVAEEPILEDKLIVEDQVRFIGEYSATIPTMNWEEFQNTNENSFLLSYDYSQYNFSDYEQHYYEISFHNTSILPKKEFLPKELDLDRIFEWSNTPVLGIQLLHEQGITGKGVNIAYIDQPLRQTHESIQGKNINYRWLDFDDYQDGGTSMHGISVASLILGDNVGAAPDVNLYFIGHPAYSRDQRSHAAAIYEVIEINKTLSKEEQIRLIGFSDNPDSSENNIQAFLDAVEIAKEHGILVLFANNNRATIKPFLDRNDPLNYEVGYINSTKVAFPTTYTIGNGQFDNQYTFWPSAGTSWTTPVAISLAAMALQVDPNFDVFKLDEYFLESAYDIEGVKIINPVGFIELVKANKQEKSYYYNVLYNSDYVTSDDKAAIEFYSNNLENDSTVVNLIDTKNINNPISIFNEMKEFDDNTNLILKGVQIFGTDEEIPSFKIHDKVDMGEYGIHDLGTIYTDHFYSNFNNDVSIINTDLSMYKIFSENINIDFNPEWQVTRLPLQKGSIYEYFNKYHDYKSQVNGVDIPVVNFSSPIFASSTSGDDFGYFIKNRLDQEFNILSPDQYRLYGNLMGYYPVSTEVLGDFNSTNLSIENDAGIMNLVINSHGQWNNIDRAYYTSADSSSGEGESFINNENVNEVLDNNYYNLFQWTCWGASELSPGSIDQLMISEGKAINIVSSSYLASNNGMDVYASLNDLQRNNGISLFYGVMKGLYYNNYSWSESFTNAIRNYIKSNLGLSEITTGNGNYQFNMNNALMFTHYGLIEETNKLYVRNDSINNLGENLDEDGIPGGFTVDFDTLPSISKNMSETFEYGDDGLEYLEIGFSHWGDNDINEVTYAGMAQDDENYYFKINYDKEIDNQFIYFFLAGDEPGLSVGTIPLSSGIGTVIIKINKEQFIQFASEIVINTGNRNFHGLIY